MLSKRDWEIVLAFSTSFSIREVARKTGFSKSTIHRWAKKNKKNVRVVFNYAAAGLNYLLLLAENSRELKTLPEGVRSLRKAYGIGEQVYVITAIVPETVLSDWMGALEASGVYVTDKLRALEFRKWNPLRSSVTWVKQVPIPLLPDLERIAAEENYPPRLITANRTPDAYDLALMHYYMLNPPWYPRGIHLDALRDGLKPIDQRRLSEHWRWHVLPLWLYNTYYIPLNQFEVPIRLLVLSGSDVYGVSRALSTIPFTLSVFIDKSRAALITQMPCNLLGSIYKVFSEFDITLEYDVVFEPSLVGWIPRLWRFVRKRGRRWEWCMPSERITVRRK